MADIYQLEREVNYYKDELEKATSDLKANKEKAYDLESKISNAKREFEYYTDQLKRAKQEEAEKKNEHRG